MLNGKTLFSGLVSVAVLTAAGVAVRVHARVPEEATGPAGAAVYTVARQEFVRTLRLNGTVEAVESHAIQAPRLAGQNGNSLVIMRLVHNGEMRLTTLLKAMSTRPAELLGLQAGTLKPGSPADVIVANIDAPWVLDPGELKSKCKNTPFDEARLQGRVLRTIVAGRTVFEYASA